MFLKILLSLAICFPMHNAEAIGEEVTPDARSLVMTDKGIHKWHKYSSSSSSSEEGKKGHNCHLPEMIECYYKEKCTDKIGCIKLVELENNLFHFYDDTSNPMNWFEARDYCRKHGMMMVRPDSSALNSALTGKLAAKFGSCCKECVWIGAHDLATEGTYRWESNGMKGFSTYFISGQPSNVDKATSDCLAYVEFTGSWGWDDRNCLNCQCMVICQQTDLCRAVQNGLYQPCAGGQAGVAGVDAQAGAAADAEAQDEEEEEEEDEEEVDTVAAIPAELQEQDADNVE